MKKLTALLACLFLTLTLLPSAAFADSLPTKDTLTIRCNYKNDPVSGVTFEVYRVAEYDGSGTFALTEAFQEAGVEAEDLVSSDTASAAEKLKTFVENHKSISPVVKAKTGTDGKASVTIERTGTEPAVYLIVGKDHTANGKKYSVSPFTLTIGGSESYSGTAKPKVSAETVNSSSPGGGGKPSEKLPQTGTYWVPVPMLLVITFSFVMVALSMKKKGLDAAGKRWLALGTITLAAAFLLTGYNLVRDRKAGAESESAVQILQQEQASAGEKRQLSAGTAEETAAEPSPVPEMPVTTIEGRDYIGTVAIPKLGLILPVQSSWNYSNLNASPCLYKGSFYSGNMVLCAHNFTAHFGKLKELNAGDEVFFTDADGNIYSYEVSETDLLNPYDVQEMTTGDWDLTLFTCTIGGRQRVTVRCIAE